MEVLAFAVSAILAYLLGGINGSIIASKYIYKKDIRQYGSGNAGLTNFYRIFGKKGAALVILIDVLKAAAAMFFACWLLGHWGMAQFGKLYAGFFAMLGHVFPVYYGFKGGKSVLCGGIMTILLDWRIGLITWGAFALGVLLTRYVSLGSIAAGAALPVCVAVFGGSWYEIFVALLCAVLLISKHSSNIARLVRGEEAKISFKKSGGGA